VSQEVKDDYVKDCATAAIDLFDEMRISRNRIVHGLPVLVPDAVTTSTLQHATARQGSGLKITTSNVTVDDLRSLVGNMSISSLAVEGGIFQFFILRMEREGHISKDDHLGNLERALLVPIEEVKSRTETLRRQRNNLPKSN